MPTINIDGVDLFYRVEGEGTPIIFIHPPLVTGYNFFYQMEGLSAFFKTIVFDIRGHGNSSFSAVPLTYPLISQDINRILDHLEIDQAYLCGYSTGGTIALDFLLTYPERSKGAILLGAVSEVNDFIIKKEISLGVMLSKKMTMETLALAVALGNSNSKAYFHNLFHESKKGNPKNIEQYFRYSLKYNCTDQLNKIKQPVLLIYGEKDRRFHGYARILNQKLPNNQLKYIKNGRHQLPAKSALEVNQLIKQFIHDH